MALQGFADRPAGGEVPHPHCPVLACGDGDGSSVKDRARRRVHVAGVALQGFADRPAGVQVPYAYGSVLACGDGDGPAVNDRASHREHAAGVASERFTDQQAGTQIPNPHCPVRARGDGDGPAVNDRASHREHAAGVAGEASAGGPASGQVPHPHRSVLACGDGDGPAVNDRAHQRVHDAGVPGGCLVYELAGDKVPHPHRSVLACGDSNGPAVKDRGRVHTMGVAGEGFADGPAGGQVPHPHRPVLACGDGDGPAINNRARHREDTRGVASEGFADGPAGGQVPHPHRPVLACGDGDGPAINDRARHRVDLTSMAGEGVTQSRVEGAARGPLGGPVARQKAPGEVMLESPGAGAGRIESQDLSPRRWFDAVVEMEAGAIDGSIKAGCVDMGMVEMGGETAGGGVDEVFAVGEEVVEKIGLVCVLGEVVEGIRVGAGPVASSVGPVGDVVGEDAGAGGVRGLEVGVLAQVFGHRFVVEPVGGAAVLGRFHNVGASCVAQPQEVVVTVGAAGDLAGEPGPDVFPRQALALGISEGAQEIGGSLRVRAEALMQVVVHGVACVARQAGLPGRIAEVRDGGGGSKSAGGDTGDEEGPAGGVGHRLGYRLNGVEVVTVRREAVGLEQRACGIDSQGCRVGVAGFVEVDDLGGVDPQTG